MYKNICGIMFATIDVLSWNSNCSHLLNRSYDLNVSYFLHHFLDFLYLSIESRMALVKRVVHCIECETNTPIQFVHCAGYYRILITIVKKKKMNLLMIGGMLIKSQEEWGQHSSVLIFSPFQTTVLGNQASLWDTRMIPLLKVALLLLVLSL